MANDHDHREGSPPASRASRLDPFTLSLRHLEAASMVARCGTITAAALAINLSQPALTQGLAKLERVLRCRLFDRGPEGMRATSAGALLAGRVDRATTLLATAAEEARGRRLAHPARQLTMSQLRAVLAVERAGSYVLAGKATGLAEPSLHRAARELEAVLGAPLLVRDGRSVRPTAAASRFVRPARLALAELQALLDELAALDEAGAGRIVVGAMPLARASMLPRAVAAFCAAHPGARVRILEGRHEELVGGLRDGEIDLLLGALRDPCPSPELVQTTLFEEGLCVVAASGHPLARATCFSAADTRGWPWVMAPAGTPMRARWEAWFAESGVPPPPLAVECSSVVAIRGLLMEGGWLTLLSPDQFRLERATGILVALGGPLPGSARAIGMTARRGWHPTRLQRAFIAAIRHASAARLPDIE